MAKNTPSFQFYPSDFLGGTDWMSATAVGIYIRLMCRIWIAGGSVPYCKKRLSSVCMVSESQFNEAWEEMKDKFTVEDGVLTQPRLSELMDKNRRTSETNSRNGKKGGRPKRDNTQLGNRNESESKAAPLKTEDRSLKDEDCWVFPDGWDTPELREALESFAQMRYTINKPIKSRKNTSRIFKRFDSVEHLLYAIDVCISNQYQGLKPEYRPEAMKGKGNSNTFNQQKAANMISELQQPLTGIGHEG